MSVEATASLGSEQVEEAHTAKIRWHGLDLLRLLCYFCILEFHFGLFYFGEPSTKYMEESWIIWFMDRLGHVFMLSGFVIVCLSSLLLAYNMKNGQHKKRIVIVLLCGCLYLSIGSYSPVGITWDVFGLFLAGLGSAMLCERRWPRSVRWLGGLGYALLWVPAWELAAYLPAGHITIKNVLGVAACGYGLPEVAEWPLLPWIGLVWFGYALGAELRQLRATHRLASLRLARREACAWVVLLGASVPQLGAYYNLRLGRFFSCEVYRQEPYLFWSHFIWALAAIRLAVEPRVQSWLAGRGWARRLSDLAISRKFWLAYALEYVYGMSLALALNHWDDRAPLSFQQGELPALELIALTLFPVNELMTRWAWSGISYLRAVASRTRARGKAAQVSS